MEVKLISGTAYSIITQGVKQFNIEIYNSYLKSFLSQDPLNLKSLISYQVSQKEKFNAQINYLFYLRGVTYMLVPVIRYDLENVLSRFKELGFSNSELQYILGFDEIDFEIENINTNGGCIIKDPAYFPYLKLYLSMRNDNIFLNHVRPLVGYSDGTRIAFDSKRLYALNENLKRNKTNRNRGMEKVSDGVFENIWGEMVKQFNTNLRNVCGLGLEEIVQASTSNTIDNLLVQFFKKYCIPASESISKSAQYREVYPLFAKLMPHRGWPKNEKEFIKADIGGGLTYIQFMTKTMRKFIEKK